jgi:hypothetical protein
MKRGRMAAAVTAGLVVSATVASSPAGAGEPAPTGTITVEPTNPTSGLPGSEWMFSGEGCVSEAGPGVMDVLVFLGGELVWEHTFGPFDADGSWGIGIVPNGIVPEEDAVGTWEVSATCFDAETWQVLVDYETTTFEVNQRPAPPTTTPPTTAPPTTAPRAATTTTTVPETPEAPPAAPVPAQPSFTG